MLRAGFAQGDITPPLGVCKIGWIIRIIAGQILDPLFARACVLDNGETAIGVIQFDTLFVPAEHAGIVRGRIAERFGFPGDRVMLAATHNHAGPAMVDSGEVTCDPDYVSHLLEQAAEVFGEALAARQPAEIGMGRAFEWEVAHNRRVRMRDGTVRTHGRFTDPEALCFDGPIDPEVGVIVVRTAEGQPLGCLVSFSCHPTHHGGDTTISAGFPGVMARALATQGCPHTLFLNGPAGNTHTADPTRDGADVDMDSAGGRLAAAVLRAREGMEFRSEVHLAARTARVALPYRSVREDEVTGTAHGAQRFVDPGAYDRGMPALLAHIKAHGHEESEIQALSINDTDLIGIGAEYFVEFGLRIKEAVYPRRALVVSLANGCVGYVPTKEAFARGGYETTFGGWSKMAPEAGDMLAEAAIALVKGA